MRTKVCINKYILFVIFCQILTIFFFLDFEKLMVALQKASELFEKIVTGPNKVCKPAFILFVIVKYQYNW